MAKIQAPAPPRGGLGGVRRCEIRNQRVEIDRFQSFPVSFGEFGTPRPRRAEKAKIGSTTPCTTPS